MSDTSQGTGWWQATDGKWYPPESHPGYRPALPPPHAAPNAGPPTAQYPQAVTQVQPAAAPPTPAGITDEPKKPAWKQGWVIALVAVIVVAAIGAAISLSGDDSADSRIVVPEVSIPGIEIPKISLPAIEIPQISLPELPAISIPGLETPLPPTRDSLPVTPGNPRPGTADLTPSQQNAVRSATSYLDFMAFSRQGLIDQLSSEYGDQFPVDDATIAVDTLNVDWNEQAAQSAQDYLDFSGFSCAELIDQLSSEYGDQFTVEQATYGATQAGIC